MKSINKPPRRRVINDNSDYSSNNYLHINITTNVIVNNNKIGFKIRADFLLNPNKYITFASDKGTFVLLTIKKLVLCLV